MRHIFLLAGASLLLCGTARGLAAQQVAQSGATQPSARANVARQAAAPPCTYAACALRVEPSFFDGPRLVRGTSGTTAAGLSTLRPAELAKLFAGNDSASVYALRFLRAERVNRVLTFGGIVLGAVGLAQPARLNGLTVVGAGMLATSVPYQIAAQRGLSRAVWWYNAALPAAPSDHE